MFYVVRIAKNNLLTPALVSTDTNEKCFFFSFAGIACGLLEM